jgi:hypothetical protein
MSLATTRPLMRLMRTSEPQTWIQAMLIFKLASSFCRTVALLTACQIKTVLRCPRISTHRHTSRHQPMARPAHNGVLHSLHLAPRHHLITIERVLQRFSKLHKDLHQSCSRSSIEESHSGILAHRHTLLVR